MVKLKLHAEGVAPLLVWKEVDSIQPSFGGGFFYDENGKSLGEKYYAYRAVTVNQSPITINGAKFYKLADGDAYIKVTNISGQGRVLKRNAYIYSTSKKRTTHNGAWKLYKGFIGSPYKKYPLGYWVAPNGVKPVVKHYLGKAQNMTNCGLPAIKDKLINSHLVVVWVGMFDGISNHAITLTGYHGKTIYYNDPWTVTKRKIKQEIFVTHWALDAHRALSY